MSKHPHKLFCAVGAWCIVCGKTTIEEAECTHKKGDPCSYCGDKLFVDSICEDHHASQVDPDEQNWPDPWYYNPGIVYALQAANQNIFKIGSTRNDVNKRLKSIQTGCPHKLVIFQEEYSERRNYHERAIHKFLREYRINGEWFKIANVEVLSEAFRCVMSPDPEE